MRKVMFLLTAAVVFAVGLGSPGAGLAQGDRLQVVASFSVLADVVHNVAGDAAEVTSLIPPGADPHAFEPTPQDLVRLAAADVVFINGVNLEGSLLRAIENAGEDMHIVTASECVPILPFGEGGGGGAPVEAAGAGESPYAEMCPAHDAAMAALGIAMDAWPDTPAVEPLGPLYTLACDPGDVHAAGGQHDHGECDPHVWLDPRNVMYWTMLIRDTLGELDPAHAETYTANAAAYVQSLAALINEDILPLVETLPVERRVLVTDHEIFGYFARAYGFRIVGLIVPSLSTQAEPSAAEMAALIDTIRAEHVPAIFVTATVSPVLAERLAEETGAVMDTLYTHSVTGPDGPAPTYLDMLRYNVRVIVTALGGGFNISE